MSCACGRRSIGNVRANRSESSGQPQTICGESDEVAHVSITSGSPVNPPGCPRCSGVYPAGTSVDGSIGSDDFVGVNRAVVFHASTRVDRIPHGKGHAEEALAADAPVAVETVHPVLVPRPHVLRVPLQLAAALEQRLAELDRLEEPLPARHDLERPIALLVELHRVRDRPRIADEIAACAQLLDDLRARFRRRQLRQLVVVALRAVCIARLPARRTPRTPAAACRST